MARITHYDQGDVWTPQASFTVGGNPTDPTNITVRIKEPDGTVTVLGPVAGGTGGGGITRVSAGVFKTDIALDDAGYWFARFEGTGTAAATEEHQAVVDPSEFYESAQLGSRALVGMAETKDWLQVQQITTENDLELARVISDISERAHQEAGREFKVAATNPHLRLFDVDALAVNRRQVRIGDLAAAPTLVRILDKDGAAVVTVAAADYTLLPRNREAWEPIQRLHFSEDVTKLLDGYVVEVTGTWGFPSVPGNVRQAVLDAVAATMDRDVEHYSQDLGVQPQEGGNVIVVGGGRQRVLSMPPVSLATLWGYQNQVYA